MKRTKSVVEIKPGKETSKIECKLCDTNKPHLICVMGKDGSIHVHGPISNDGLMTDFLIAILTEREKQRVDGNH